MNARGVSAGDQGARGEITTAQWAELEAQMRELEVLMEETEVPPALLSAYWEASADLIALLEETKTVLATVRADLLEPRVIRERYVDLRRRLLSAQARAQELTLDAGIEQPSLDSW